MHDRNIQDVGKTARFEITSVIFLILYANVESKNKVKAELSVNSIRCHYNPKSNWRR